MECLDSLLSVLKAPFTSLSYFGTFLYVWFPPALMCPPSAVDEIVLTWREAEMNPTTFTSKVFSHFEGENILV